jgi:hypothetical protein
MALTDSLPTGDAGGLTVADERLILAGLIAKNADGSPRVGIFPSGVGALVTGRASMGYDVGQFKGASSRTGTGIELAANDAQATVATTAAPGANSRIDVIWWRPQFTANTDPGNVPIFGVTQGTAAGVPTKPPIPAGAAELATAVIPSTATTTASVVITQTYQFTAAAGGIVLVRNATELAAYAAADETTARNIADGSVWRRTGGAWVQDGATASQANIRGTNWGTVSADEVVRAGRMAIYRFNALRTTNTLAAGGVIATVPTAFRGTKNSWGHAWGLLGAANAVQVFYEASTGTVKTNVPITAGQSIALTLMWEL